MTYVSEAMEMWNSLSEDEREAFIKENQRQTQLMLVRSDEEAIATNNNLIEITKRLIKKRINKADYTKEDEEFVKLGLEVIKGCEDDNKRIKRDLRLLIKYPVGSRFRPGYALQKETKDE